MNPWTQERIQRFWRNVNIYQDDDGWWIYPDGLKRKNKPSITSLKDLLKWAEPGLDGYTLSKQAERCDTVLATSRTCNRYFKAEANTPALALAEAMEKAFKAQDE